MTSSTLNVDRIVSNGLPAQKGLLDVTIRLFGPKIRYRMDDGTRLQAENGERSEEKNTLCPN